MLHTENIAYVDRKCCFVLSGVRCVTKHCKVR